MVWQIIDFSGSRTSSSLHQTGNIIEKEVVDDNTDNQRKS